jgi:hypothetical protein
MSFEERVNSPLRSNYILSKKSEPGKELFAWGPISITQRTVPGMKIADAKGITVLDPIKPPIPPETPKL